MNTQYRLQSFLHYPWSWWLSLLLTNKGWHPFIIIQFVSAVCDGRRQELQIFRASLTPLGSHTFHISRVHGPFRSKGVTQIETSLQTLLTTHASPGGSLTPPRPHSGKGADLQDRQAWGGHVCSLWFSPALISGADSPNSGFLGKSPLLQLLQSLE